MTTSTHSLRTNVNAIELDHLSRRYKDEAHQRARERLVLAWRPLVSYAASRIGRGLPSHVDEAERRATDQSSNPRRAAQARLGPALRAREGV